MSKNSKSFKHILRNIVLSLLGIALVAALTFAVLAFVNKNGNLLGDGALFKARSDLDNSKLNEEYIENHQVAPDEPRYMTIERLGINRARVMGIGVSGDNNQLGDPANVHDVGWYTASAKPGQMTQNKPAGLYDGHNTGIYERGVFYRLGDLTTQDLITIERGDGEKLTYQVQEINTVPIADVDMKKMLESAIPDVEGLNIISCSGTWNNELNTYSHRVLVRATLVEN